MSIISRKIDSAVEQRKKDGYINATKLCNVHNERTGEGKLPKHWLENKGAKSIIEKLSVVSGIPLSLLIQVNRGGKAQGTWIHPRLAVRFTMWLDEEFSLQVEDLVQAWIKNDADRKAKQSPWGKVREEGMETRREFTDAIQDYVERHPQLPEDSKKYLYARATDDTYMVLFGRTARQLYIDFEVEDRAGLRDKLTKKELQHIQSMEDMAMRLVDANPNMHPCAAVQDAAKRLIIPMSNRSLRSLPG